MSKLTTAKLPGTKETVTDMFVRRAGERFSAFVGIASASFDTCHALEWAGYIAASAINTVSNTFGWETPCQVSETILMSLLMTNIWHRRHEASRSTTITLFTGLADDWLGDLILMPNKLNLNRGSVPPAINQFAYCTLLWRAGVRISALRTAARLPLWAGSIPLINAVKPGVLSTAIGCGLLLVAISTLADDPVLLRSAEAVGTDEQTGLPIADAAYGLGYDGNLFLIPGTLLIVRKMFTREGVVGRPLNAAVTDTYTMAQLFLAEGPSALDRV